MTRIIQFFVILITFFVIPISYNGMKYDMRNARDILFSLIAVLLFGIYVCFKNERKRFPFRGFFYFLCWIIVSYSINFFLPTNAPVYFHKIILAFMLIYTLHGFIEKEHIHSLINAIYLVVFIQLGWLILQALNIDPIYYPIGAGGQADPTQRNPLVGSMGNAHFLGLLTAIATPLFINKRHKLMILVPLVILCVIRSWLAFASALFGLWTYCFLTFNKQRKTLLLLTTLALSIIILYSKYIDLPGLERVEVWKIIVVNFLKGHPFRLIWGYGLGFFPNLVIVVRNTYFAQAHSDFIQLCLEIGTIPTIIFTSLYIINKSRLAWRLRGDRLSNKLFASYCVIIFGYLFSFIFRLAPIAFISIIIIVCMEALQNDLLPQR